MHRSYDLWIAYIENRLPEAEREEAERHLYVCDDCLALYLRVVDQQSVAWEEERAKAVTAEVMDTIQSQGQSSVSKRQMQRERRRRLIHYTVAASLTLLLMSSGVFQQLMSYTESWRNAYEVADQQKVPNAERVMKHATSLLEGWMKRASHN